MPAKEIICVRKLTVSDLGWFDAHQATTASNQRAITIKSDVAKAIVSAQAWKDEGIELSCRCVWPGAEHSSYRKFSLVGKNWRLGGAKMEGKIFQHIGSGDYCVIRSVLGNNGSSEVLITFISAKKNAAAHRRLSRTWGTKMAERSSGSTLALKTGSPEFDKLATLAFGAEHPVSKPMAGFPQSTPQLKASKVPPYIPPIPQDRKNGPKRSRTVQDRIRSPHILSQMLKVSSDFSAEAQYEFIKVLGLLAEQLRSALQAAGMISSIERNHAKLWKEIKGQKVAFVDGGMANLSMLGSVPIAVRVGGYVVRPGDRTAEREQFIMAKHLIDELYSYPAGKGIFAGSFPDPAPLRDAARISVEAAGGVHILSEDADVRYMFMHGSLVNPVSRYTDIMDNGQVVAKFPDFSPKALELLLSKGDRGRKGRDANFIRVYLRQLELLESSKAVVCGVVERESAATSVFHGVLEKVIEHPDVPELLPKAPKEWVRWFVTMAESFRITDALLFRCVLQPGEVLKPVEIDRNQLRRAPAAWMDDIQRYPKPWASYMLPSEWGQPVRIEIFKRDMNRFFDISRLVMHCAWLLPRYAFPVGLDIVDKYAKVPNWMTRPVNTNTAVQALRQALDSKDAATFDAMRRMLCGSTRDWLFRPTVL